MTVYLIGQLEITDVDTFRRYSEQVAATVQQYGGRYLVRGGSIETLEGALSGSRLVVVEFVSKESAKRWYSSEEYVPLIKLRQSASEGDIVLVDGVE